MPLLLSQVFSELQDELTRKQTGVIRIPCGISVVGGGQSDITLGKSGNFIEGA